MWQLTICFLCFFLVCSEMDFSLGDNGHVEKRTAFSKRFFWSGGSGSSELEQLVNLIVQRLLLADKVAVSKWDSKQPIEDLPREQIILQRVVEQAQNSGLDPTWARLFFIDQIEANKDIQTGLHKRWAARGGRPTGPGVNLDSEVRPKIDVINASLMTLSKATKSERSLRSCKIATGEITRLLAFHRYKLSYLHRQALRRAYLCLKRSRETIFHDFHGV